MNLFRPALLFWVCILALLGAATAGAQTPPLEASFAVTPAEPVANAPVTFTDTTKNPTNAKLEYAWDLDADDVFDDGTTPAVTKTFPAGQHRVALRVRRIGTTTQTDTTALTITVKSAPTPTATAEPTATAPAIAAPRLNLPPQATLDHQCGPAGPAQLCLGPLVRLGKPKTFDASGSTDADGTIVRYQWDVDGNNVYELDTGTNPKLTTTIRDERRANLRVRVTDNDGATDIVAMRLIKLEPACQSFVRFERVVVTSPCLRKYEIAHGTQYRSKLPVKVNGLTIAPVNGKQVLVNLLGAGLLRKYQIISGKAVASFPVKDEHVVHPEGRAALELQEPRDPERRLTQRQADRRPRDHRRAEEHLAADPRHRAHDGVPEAAGRLRRAHGREASARARRSASSNAARARRARSARRPARRVGCRGSRQPAPPSGARSWPWSSRTAWSPISSSSPTTALPARRRRGRSSGCAPSGSSRACG